MKRVVVEVIVDQRSGREFGGKEVGMRVAAALGDVKIKIDDATFDVTQTKVQRVEHTPQ